MARRRPPVETRVIDGRAVVVLEPNEFEVLDSTRRQLGGSRAQVTRLSGDLRREREKVEALTRRIEDGDALLQILPCRCDESGRCGRCAAIRALRTDTHDPEISTKSERR